MLVLHPTFDNVAMHIFFTDVARLHLSARTKTQMGVEGISSVVDLHAFLKDDIEAIARNFDRPGRVVNGGGNLVNQAAYVFPIKSQKRLLIAVELARFYEQTNRVVTPAMMMWLVMKNFKIQMDALKETTAPQDITPIKSGVPITKFLE